MRPRVAIEPSCKTVSFSSHIDYFIVSLEFSRGAGDASIDKGYDHSPHVPVSLSVHVPSDCFVNAIRKLAENPRPRGCRKLRDYSDVYRIRVDVFRILYSIEQANLLILVLKIGHRRDVYR